LFLLKSGALRFGRRPVTATMELPQLELSGDISGNPLVGLVVAATRFASRVAVDVAVWIPRIRR
jgi:hypothetical protein